MKSIWPNNELPFDGKVSYFGSILPPGKADQYFDALLTSIQWRQETLKMFGKEIITKRKVAWYADQPFQYAYSGSTKIALSWTDELQQLKRLVEDITSEAYNSALLNLYHSGEEGMGWHSDNEPELEATASIASLSLGATRKFSFKHQSTKNTVSLFLEQGSLLLMQPPTQRYWMHCLPKSKKVNEVRINITFRMIRC